MLIHVVTGTGKTLVMAVRGQHLVSQGQHVHVISLHGSWSEAGNQHLVHQMRQSLTPEPVLCTKRYHVDQNTGVVTLVKTTVTPVTSSAVNVTLHLIDIGNVDCRVEQTVMKALRRELSVSTPPNHTMHVFSDEATSLIIDIFVRYV